MILLIGGAGMRRLNPPRHSHMASNSFPGTNYLELATTHFTNMQKGVGLGALSGEPNIGLPAHVTVSWIWGQGGYVDG